MKDWKFLILFLGCICMAQLPAQDMVDVQEPTIQVLSRAKQDRIFLRWSGDTPVSWKLLNKYGYKLVRYTVTRDQKSVLTPEIKVIGEFKPEPVETWEDLVQNNDNAGIMAQAIYGEGFEITGGGKLEAIVGLSEELQQRFTFALYTADQDFNVAIKAGLGYIDTDVRANEKYLYKITSLVPETLKVIKEGGSFTGISDYEPLPIPLDLAATFTDGNAMLSWNFKVLSTVYNSYRVERSRDGVNFKRVNDKPYTILNPEVLDQKNGRIFYVDSITNNQKYTYRVKGISSFGEVGPASKAVSGEGTTVLKYVPHLRTKKTINDNSIQLTWEFPEDGNSQITGFELNRAPKESGPYTIVKSNIPLQDRSVLIDDLLATNYFTLTAVGKQNNKRTSFPMLVQPADSIPPAIPLGLKGTIDTLGVVKLSWDKNMEPDMLGYRVYIANEKEHEFSQLTVNPIQRNSYIDTIKVKNLNKKIYYRLTALDKRYNMSDLSEILELERPDVIPPTSPVFKSYKLTNEGVINLNWASSSSDDVVNHLLYRKQNDNDQWVLVFEGDKSSESYIDKDVEEGNLYSYTILAKDDSGLESEPSPSVSIGVKRTGLKPKVKGFYANANPNKNSVVLSWRYKEPKVSVFEIYKTEQDAPLRLFKKVIAGTKVLEDTDLTINTTYKYAIRAVFTDGNISEMSEIEVKY